MKKAFLVFSLLIISIFSFAGIEVPWPEDAVRDVYLRDLPGSWVSENLNNPQRILTVKLEMVADETVSCPYIITVSELNPFNGKVVAQDRDVFCSSFQRKLILILTDELGQARKQVEIVGIKKPKNDDHLGYQYLGVTVYNYGEIKEKLYQDIFYKFSL